MHDLLVRYRKYSLLAVVLLAGVSLLTLQHARPDDGSWLAEGSGFPGGLARGRGRGGGSDRLAPVVVARGGGGRVAVLRRSSAVVQLLTDPASSIGAIVHGTRAQGLVEGVAGGRLRLKLAAGEEGVRPGDLVYTSGIGELFPKGLPLGRVLRVYPPARLFRTAEIEPAVDLATLRAVPR